MLKEKLKELAQANQKHQEALEVFKTRETELHALPEYKDLEEALEETYKIRDEVNALRTKISELALEAYTQTGEKKPASGVGIKVTKELVYYDEQALEFCIENLPNALKLDKRFFEKHAKGVAETQPLNFVTIKEKPTATISSDLSEYLV